MSYISSIKSMEEIGMEAGILKANRENTIKLLELRFGVVSDSIAERINGIEDETVSQTLLLQAATTVDLEAFQQLLKTVAHRKPADKSVPYISSIEQMAMEEGSLKTQRKNAIKVLELRFGSVSDSIAEHINGIEDGTVLESLLEQATTAASLETFQQLLKTVAT